MTAGLPAGLPGQVPVEALVVGVAAATPGPSPSPRSDLEATDATPGLLGFVVTFAVALAAIGLLLSMVGKLRRVNREGPAREAAEGEPPAPGDGATPPTAPTRP